MSRRANPVLTLSELRELALSPYAAEAASPLSGAPYRIVDLGASARSDTLEQAELENLAAWVRRQPCPVIAIADDSIEPRRREPFDVIAADEADARGLTRLIEQSPMAALILVQVLRTTEGIPIAQALTVESLAYSTLQSGPEFRRWLREQAPHLQRAGRGDRGPAVLIGRDGGHLRLTLNRPSRRNAVSVEMRDELVEALQLVLADASIHAVEIRANGACFSIGGDLAEFGSAPDPATAHVVRSLRLPGALLAQCAARVHVHVHSACIGAGLEIPAFAARVSAAGNAFFQLPELRFGLIPGAGGCVSLPRRIGRQRTAYLAFSARRINAATALDWGLIDAIAE